MIGNVFMISQKRKVEKNYKKKRKTVLKIDNRPIISRKMFDIIFIYYISKVICIKINE